MSRIGLLLGLVGAVMPPRRRDEPAPRPPREDLREAAAIMGRNAAHYMVEIAPLQRGLLLGDMRKIHGWSPKNEGRACRCERCVRRRRYHASHRGAR